MTALSVLNNGLPCVTAAIAGASVGNLVLRGSSIHPYSVLGITAQGSIALIFELTVLLLPTERHLSALATKIAPNSAQLALGGIGAAITLAISTLALQTFKGKCYPSLQVGLSITAGILYSSQYKEPNVTGEIPLPPTEPPPQELIERLRKPTKENINFVINNLDLSRFCGNRLVEAIATVLFYKSSFPIRDAKEITPLTKPESTHISALPRNLWEIICKFLPLQDSVNAAVTCRYLFHTINGVFQRRGLGCIQAVREMHGLPHLKAINQVYSSAWVRVDQFRSTLALKPYAAINLMLLEQALFLAWPSELLGNLCEMTRGRADQLVDMGDRVVTLTRNRLVNAMPIFFDSQASPQDRFMRLLEWVNYFQIEHAFLVVRFLRDHPECLGTADGPAIFDYFSKDQRGYPAYLQTVVANRNSRSRFLPGLLSRFGLPLNALEPFCMGVTKGWQTRAIDDSDLTSIRNIFQRISMDHPTFDFNGKIPDELLQKLQNHPVGNLIGLDPDEKTDAFLRKALPPANLLEG